MKAVKTIIFEITRQENKGRFTAFIYIRADGFEFGLN